MWWLFEKLSETDETVLYAYSRENRALDGRVSIDKATRMPAIVKPCAADSGSRWAANKAEEKAYLLAGKNYPQHIQIACG